MPTSAPGTQYEFAAPFGDQTIILWGDVGIAPYGSTIHQTTKLQFAL